MRVAVGVLSLWRNCGTGMTDTLGPNLTDKPTHYVHMVAGSDTLHLLLLLF